MRKLKTSLSLVLALVMALSLMVPASFAAKDIGTDVADYFDDYSAAESFIKDNYGDEADSILNALKVVTDLKIVSGDAVGGNINVNADESLTRLEYIVLLYTLTNTTPLEKSIYAGMQPVFEDINFELWNSVNPIAATNWAYANAITFGTSTKSLIFSPDEPINYYDAMWMLLGQLGVNAKVEFNIGTGEGQVPFVKDELRFMKAIELASRTWNSTGNAYNFNLLITPLDSGNLNRIEAMNMMHKALSATIVKQTAANTFAVASAADTVFAKSHKGTTLKGYISATKYVDIRGNNGVKDGYVAVFTPYTLVDDKRTGDADVAYQIDAATAEQLGLKLEGFDNLRNLGEEYTIMTQTANVSGTNKIFNIISSTKTSGSSETMAAKSEYDAASYRSAIGNDKLTYDIAKDISDFYVTYQNFAVVANPESKSKASLLNVGDGNYKKLIWNSDNKIVRIFNINSFKYEAVPGISDDKYTLNGVAQKVADIVGYDADKFVKDAHVLSYKVGTTTGVFYPELIEGTATKHSSDNKTATVNSTDFFLEAGVSAITYAAKIGDYVKATETSVYNAFGSKVNYYVFQEFGVKIALSVLGSSSNYDPKDYAIVVNSYYVPGQAAIPGVQDAKDPSGVVTLLFEDGTAGNYTLNSIMRGGAVADTHYWRSTTSKYIAESSNNAFDYSSNGILYTGTNAYSTKALLHNIPFAYLLSGDKSSVTLYEIPTLQKTTIASATAEDPIDNSNYFRNIHAGVNGKRVTAETAVFTNSASDKGISEAAKGAGNIAKSKATAGASYSVYYLNTDLGGAYNPLGANNRLLVLQVTNGEATMLRNLGTGNWYYVLANRELLANGSAQQVVLDKNGDVVTLVTVNQGHGAMAGIGAGTYVQYTLDPSGKVTGRDTFKNGMTQDALPENVYDRYVSSDVLATITGEPIQHGDWTGHQMYYDISANEEVWAAKDEVQNLIITFTEPLATARTITTGFINEEQFTGEISVQVEAGVTYVEIPLANNAKTEAWRASDNSLGRLMIGSAGTVAITEGLIEKIELMGARKNYAMIDNIVEFASTSGDAPSKDDTQRWSTVGKDSLVYMSAQGIVTDADFYYASNAAIYFVGEANYNHSMCAKIDAATAATYYNDIKAGGAYSLRVYLNVNGEIEKMYIVKAY